MIRNGSGSRGWCKFICVIGYLISIIFFNIYFWWVCIFIIYIIVVCGCIVFGFIFEGRWFWWFFFVVFCIIVFCCFFSCFFFMFNFFLFGFFVFELDLELKINFILLNDLFYLICINFMIWDFNLLFDYDYFDGWFVFWDG